MRRVRLIISGDVIGVGYRAWAKRQAAGLGITGWVKNRVDGAVELVAEGESESLEKLVILCQKGPDVAWVERVQVEWGKATNEFLDFVVLY